MQAPVYNTDGKETRTISLPESVFGARFNADLVHQVVTAIASNARTPVAHTKDRGDVSGGGKKPWRQKGTGRARHGSTRSPIWRGGGATFGPRNEKSYAKKVNRKMRAKALAAVLSRKFADGEVLFVDSFEFAEPKTAAAKEVLAALATGSGADALVAKKRNAAVIALPAYDAAVAKSFRNFGNIAVHSVASINPLTVLSAKYLIIADPDAALEVLEKRVAGARSEQAAAVEA